MYLHFTRLWEFAKSAILAIALLVSTADAAVGTSALEDNGRIEATVAWSNVIMPGGRILLIKSSQGICALRFLTFERRNDGRPATTFDGGEETQTASYEWRFFRIGGGSSHPTTEKTGHGSVTQKAAYGIGRFVLLGGGNDTIKCGPIRAIWSPPASVFFSDYHDSGSPGLELAPTARTSLVDVDPSDSSLTWFKLDKNREQFRLPLDAP
jgi:hypothetical protein